MARLASRLRARGHEVHVVSMRPPLAFTTELAAADVPVFSLEMGRSRLSRRTFRAWREAVRLIRRLRPEVLVTMTFPADMLGRCVAPFARETSLVNSYRNEEFGGRQRDVLLRATHCLAAAVTVNSEFAARKLVARGVLPNGDVHVIPNGIDTSRYRCAHERREEMRRRLDIDSRSFVWLAVGRLEAGKDYPNLLTASSRLRQDLEHTLLIAGQGALASDLESLARRLGVLDQVRFLGLRQDVPELLAAADGFVLSSAWEGLPNVLMEAMAVGKPVVATDVGGVRELVDDASGIIVPSGDPSALAQAMARLMELPEPERDRMARAGQRIIERKCELDAVVDQWEQFLIPVARGSIRRRATA